MGFSPLQVVAVMGLLLEDKKLACPTVYKLQRGVGQKLRCKIAAEVRNRCLPRAVQDRLTWVPDGDHK